MLPRKRWFLAFAVLALALCAVGALAEADAVPASALVEAEVPEIEWELGEFDEPAATGTSETTPPRLTLN